MIGTGYVVPSWSNHFAETFSCTSRDAGTCKDRPDVSNFRNRGATAFAALLSGAYRPQKDERVCVILCGANTDPETFSKVMIT